MEFPGVPKLSTFQGEQLEAFADLVAETAVNAGLVGFAGVDAYREIQRSLCLLQVVPKSEGLIDVGTGAGFPGIPLAIALGGGTLVEPKAKAVAFLEKVIRELDLNVQLIPMTAEQAARGALRESGDAITSRAVAPLEAAAELCAPLCRVGGKVIVTAAAGGETIEMSAGLLYELGISTPQTQTLAGPPGLDIRQRVHIMSKTHPTSPKYPRRGRRRSSGRIW